MCNSITIRKFFSLLVLAVASALTIGAARADVSDFPAKVRHPLKWMFISELSDNDIRRFIQLVKDIDDGRILDLTSPIENLLDADLVLFLLNDWKDVERLPWQDIFSEQYQRVLNTTEKADGVFIELRVNGGKPFMLTFLKRRKGSGEVLECTAAYFLTSFDTSSDETKYRKMGCAEFK